MTSPPQRRVPLELEPLGDLDKGSMSEGIWRELNDTIQYEAKSVQATGVIIPSPARNRRAGSNSPGSASSPNAGDGAGADSKEVAVAATVGSTKFPQRFPAMEKFFQALATMGMSKHNNKGLAMLHNAAQLGVWQSSHGGVNAEMQAQVRDKVAAQSEAIDETLRQASDRARVLREEQARELAASGKAAGNKDGQPPKAGDDQYLKDLQASRIDAEFERMRDQLRAEDAVRREQLDYAREQKQKASAAQDLAERKQRLKEEREQRQREREERLRELQSLESAALGQLEHNIKEHKKSSPAKAGGAGGGASAATAAAAADGDEL